jgi:hypothetical protein
MKQKTQYLYYLYYPRGWVIIASLLFSTIVIAQEQTSPGDKFILGAAFSGKPERRSEPTYYDTFYTSGMNSILQWAVNGPNGNKSLTQRFNLMAVNQDSLEWPGYYATCYYTKWEAEQNQTDPERVGVKHVGGQSWWWHDTLCWSTRNVIAPACSLIYGPHYRQDNRYKSWAHGEDRYDVRYYVRYRMALDNSGEASPELPVCKIKVIYRYAEEYPYGGWQVFEDTFLVRTLTVGDFPQGGYFKYFYLDDDTLWYKYPSRFQLPKYAGKLIDPEPPDTITYNDSEAGLGIQFWVDWLIDSNEEAGLTLFVDHIEVFDRDWYERYLPNPASAESLIVNYAAGFSDWSNIKYFLGMDEPYSIDAFTPLRIVDSLLYNNPYYPDKHRLLTVFNPYWSHNNKINGDTLLSQFVRMANPEQLIVDIYPFAVGFPVARFEDFEYLRHTFQKCHSLRPGFWYMGQTFGEYYWNNNQLVPWVWRYPEDEELNASIMLALAHGSKGVFGWLYDSYTYTGYGDTLVHHIKGMREEDANLSPTPHWYYLRDDLVPRLKGKLGKTLMKLNYTGEYLQLQRKENESPPPPVEHNYLTLGDGVPALLLMNWHCGLFDRSSHPDDNYFMLTNLITTDSKHLRITLKPPVNTSFINYRFRNIEGLFDTTFKAPNNFTMQIEHSAGEGYLYQFAPVVQYGGRLLYSEATQPAMILEDDMTIENGAVLTINGVYSSKGNIIVKNGTIINGSDGKIQFAEGKKLIIEGNGTILSTSGNKLELIFTERQDDNITGIMIQPGGSLSISNCKVADATIGIESLLNANYLYAQNVEFINCETHSISIAGRSPGMNPTPPPTNHQL